MAAHGAQQDGDSANEASNTLREQVVGIATSEDLLNALDNSNYHEQADAHNGSSRNPLERIDGRNAQ